MRNNLLHVMNEYFNVRNQSFILYKIIVSIDDQFSFHCNVSEGHLRKAYGSSHLNEAMLGSPLSCQIVRLLITHKVIVPIQNHFRNRNNPYRKF